MRIVIRQSQSAWKWSGLAGHFICSQWCRYHLCTEVRGYRVSTVGEYVPTDDVRRVMAQSRAYDGPTRGDAFEAEWIRRYGFEEIGYGRTYETMVFKLSDKLCDCGCGQHKVTDFGEIDFAAANDVLTAQRNHMELCLKYSVIWQFDPAAWLRRLRERIKLPAAERVSPVDDEVKGTD